MDAGYSVAWADLDAMGSGELLQRLRALGVRDDVIDGQFLYYEPSERLVDERARRGMRRDREIAGSGSSSSTPSTGC